MKTKAEIFEEEKALIEEIKNAIATSGRPYKDPQKLLTLLSFDGHIKWVHVKRRDQLLEVLNNVKNLSRIESELKAMTQKRKKRINLIMDLIHTHTHKIDEDRDSQLRKELFDLLY